ncbi:flavodoxin [Enterococcus sp. JM4C]|uniref:flavodoxin n=1 Tax=Candidatus Enterococcus huntleyi TaxID=1857217 RepID=UPI001379D7BD|nr:flavodoxin [Enterococcus sp. JM4C]KAF1299465.1 flavodoxin [Enterococcus sp. JM4C]
MTAIIYFSRSGENLIYGEKKILTAGNTAIVAQKIATHLKVPLYEVEPVNGYPKSYEETIARAKEEQETRQFPDYQPFPISLENYSNLFVGFPNWWGSFPRVIASVLTSQALAGKVIYPFCTHEGSGMGDSVEELRKLCSESLIMEGLPIRGSRAEKSDVAIDHWLKNYYRHERYSDCDNLKH